MQFNLKVASSSFVLASLLAGCAVTPYNEEEKYQPLQDKPTQLVVERSDTYVREVTPEEAVFNRKVSFSGKVALVDAIRKQFDDVNIVPGDQNVELNKEISVFARDMYMKDYLDYLEAVTGYAIEYSRGVITVRSFVRKEWNVSAFASHRTVRLNVGSTFNTETTTVQTDGGSTSKGGAGNKIESNYTDDEWDILVDGARDILNVEVKEGSNTSTDSQIPSPYPNLPNFNSGKANSSSTSVDAEDTGYLKPYVQAIRSVGTISVGGQANRVEALDEFITNLVERGQRQVNINVQAYDVTLNDDRGAGIDWTQLALKDATINGNPFDFSLKNIKSENDGIWAANIGYSSDSVDANAIVQFLSDYGEVELLTQPNVTVRNGSYAYISTGEELTFIGSIETQEGDNNNDRVTATLNSVRIGVTLAVTPRVLGDGRIMLEIWPVISSVSGESTFSFQGLSYEVPNIALNELSTEVITESGKPIQLGGFIRRSVAKSLQDLPWKDKVTQSLVNPLFRSESNELSRRELVLTVTPTIVEGV